MLKFKSGDIISSKTLNNIDTYIKNIYMSTIEKNSVDKQSIINLYNEWINIPVGTDDTSINDELDAIIQKQEIFIKQ